MILELPSFSFDENLREVPQSVSDFESFIQNCKNALQIEAVANRQDLLAKLGFPLRITGKLDESIVFLKKALAICSLHEHLKLANAKIRIAHTYQWKKRFDLSNEIFEEIELVYLNKPSSDVFKGTFWQHKGKNEFDQKRFAIKFK